MAAESTSTTPAENGESTQQRKLVSKSAEKPRISASDDLQTVGEDVDEADIISEMRNATIPPSVLLDQERYLPIANVVRIMKTQMDPQAKLAKDAKECVQECVSEFISFIAAEAAELCHNMKRKTITADDLLTALEATGFDNYAEPMRVFLMKYRQAHKVTGPIHKPHANYNRPKHFLEDQPLRPLFFDTAQGRRCTETQYVINGCEVAKNAPLADEWNEQTGTLNTPPVAPNPPLIHHQIPGFHSGATKVVQRAQLPPSIKPAAPITSGAPLRIISANDVTGIPEGAIALEQQQQMQIYIDPQSRQHYAVMESGNGLELFPVEIQDRPLQLENVNMPSNFVIQLADGTTGTVVAPNSSFFRKRKENEEQGEVPEESPAKRAFLKK